MADVSVEFGAKDTGLEQTLKTVQDQLNNLESEVKSGTLSFDDLQKKMREISQAEKVQEQLREIAGEMKKTGNEAKDVGEKSQGGFLKMASAVAAGQAAVNIATAAMKAAFNVVKGAVDDFGAALDLGGRLSDLSARTGEAAGNVLLLERAFQNSGAGADKVGPAINKLQKFIEDAGTGAKEQVDAMDRLGLSLSDLAGKTPTEQMQVFADRISSIEDPGKRAALAMEVFGRAGGELLPLLTNFSGELGTAQDQLGGMVDIMNRQNATFDAVSDKIAIIRGKFMEFAAGVLDKVAPALDAVTEALSRIDAAAIGQKFADMFTGGIEAMNGFQASVDAFKTGNIETALSILWQSIKVQAMMTGDEIFKRLTAGFSATWEFVKEIFAPDGMIVTYIVGAFNLVAAKITEAMGNAFLSFIDALPGWFTKINPVIGMLGDTIRTVVNTASEDAQTIWGAMYHDVGLVGDQIAVAAGNIKNNFNQSLNESSGLFANTNAEAEKLKQMQAEVSAEAAKHAPAIVEATNATQALLEEEKKKLAAELESSKAKADAAEIVFSQIENEIALNNAIASGNVEEQRRIETLIEQEKAQDAIAKKAQEIVDKTGASADEALRLATELYNSETAAKAAKKVVSDISETDMAAPAKDLKERTADARDQLEKMKNFIGEDLSRMSLSSITQKLGLDKPGLQSSEDQLRDLEEYLNNLDKKEPANITPKVEEQEVKDALSQIDADMKVNPKIDKESLQNEIDVAMQSSKGTEHLSSIDKLVGKIEELVSKIEGKLPMQALAY